MSAEASPPSTSPEVTDGDLLDGGDRIFRFLKYMFARHDPGEKASISKIQLDTAAPI